MMATIEDGGHGLGSVVGRLTGLGPRGILRSVMSVSPMPMVLTDPHKPDFPMIFCNQAFTMLTGFSEGRGARP